MDQMKLLSEAQPGTPLGRNVYFLSNVYQYFSIPDLSVEKYLRRVIKNPMFS